MSRTTSLVAGAAGLVALSAAAQAAPQALIHTNPRTAIQRCGTLAGPDYGLDVPGDCSSSQTNPDPVYSPGNLDVVEIPVVFHVISSSSGQGNLSSSQIQSQIDILNEDFRALSGTPGAPGVDTGIQFVLADTDPNGNPTNGITRVTNNTWYQQGIQESYRASLNWNPNRYLNIYTNLTAGGGLLGFATIPQLQSPQAGTSRDGVTLNWRSVGRNAPLVPYNQGRTATHEVGHYLGLFHTFGNTSGCGGGNCLTSGDLICDTNAESDPNFGCNAGSASCGSTDPVRNYMNYSDDTCMNRFTLEQSRRMRCTLEFWRPNLAQPTAPVLGENYCMANNNSTGTFATILAQGSKEVAQNNLVLTATQLPVNTVGFFIVSPNQAFVANAGGSSGNLCVGASTGRYVAQIGNSGFFGQIGIAVDLTAVPQPNGNAVVAAGETWNWQCWYRDAVLGFPTSNFSDGYTVTFE